MCVMKQSDGRYYLFIFQLLIVFGYHSRVGVKAPGAMSVYIYTALDVEVR